VVGKEHFVRARIQILHRGVTGPKLTAAYNLRKAKQLKWLSVNALNALKIASQRDSLWRLPSAPPPIDPHEPRIACGVAIRFRSRKFAAETE